MAHACNPSYLRGRGRRITVEVIPGKSMGPHKKQTKPWLKWQSAFLASMKPMVQSPEPLKKRKK
jgi:hypothetical protein